MMHNRAISVTNQSSHEGHSPCLLTAIEYYQSFFSSVCHIFIAKYCLIDSLPKLTNATLKCD